MRSPITTHVLDLARGCPAAGIEVVLLQQLDSQQWQEIARGQTDSDGRLNKLLPSAASVKAGVYRLSFLVSAYYQTRNVDHFHPEINITFRITNPREHYHVPLLLSPFGYSTYRGS